jgi:hypothetical protein
VPPSGNLGVAYLKCGVVWGEVLCCTPCDTTLVPTLTLYPAFLFFLTATHTMIAWTPKQGSLTVEYRASSVLGLNSVTTLIKGKKSALLVDPPFLVPDALEVVKWLKESLSGGQKLFAVRCILHDYR